MDSDWVGAAGAWICGGAIWIVSREARLPGACYAGAFVWAFGVVWDGADTCWSGGVSFVGVELCAAGAGFEPGRGGAGAAVSAGGARGGVLGVGGIGDGDLFDFGPGFGEWRVVRGIGNGCDGLRWEPEGLRSITPRDLSYRLRPSCALSEHRANSAIRLGEQLSDGFMLIRLGLTRMTTRQGG